MAFYPVEEAEEESFVEGMGHPKCVQDRNLLESCSSTVLQETFETAKKIAKQYRLSITDYNEHIPKQDGEVIDAIVDINEKIMRAVVERQ